jgi:hypothetical protein
MDTASAHEFLAASAGVAGALIGLFSSLARRRAAIEDSGPPDRQEP